MKSCHRFSVLSGMLCLGSLAFYGLQAQAASPSAAQALRLTPTQDGVEYDRPKPDDVAKCKIVAETIEGHVGWVVQGPDGNTLRRFVDTNGDNVVDQWSYYKDGIEVYRDIATKASGKADQFRWLHMGGSRWGEDVTGSAKLEKWRAISAEEVSAEIVAAFAHRDIARFNRVLLTSSELSSLGLGKAKTAAIEVKIAKAADDFKTMADRQRAITMDTHWLQFSGNRPGVVPAGTEESTKDIEVYENTMAIFESGDRHGQIQIGTLVHVDNVWKVVGAPAIAGEPGAETVAENIFFKPLTARSAGEVVATSDEAKDLAKVLADMVPGDPKGLPLIDAFIEKAKSADERNGAYRQLADWIVAGSQSKQLTDGNKRLRELFQKIQAGGSDKPLEAYVKLRLLSSEYGTEMEKEKGNVPQLQVDWLKDLKKFVEDYPTTPDTAEAMLQLGIAEENAGQDEDAKKCYERIVNEFHDAPQAKKATGAVVRLDSVGKVLRLSGSGLEGGTVDLSSYRGRVVVVQYWATSSGQAKTDIDKLKKLLTQYGKSLAVVGVSLDNNAKDVQTFLKDNPLPWRQIYEEGGQDSRPANALGIITVPTMIVVDADGKVVSRNAQMAELDTTVKSLIR